MMMARSTRCVSVLILAVVAGGWIAPAPVSAADADAGEGRRGPWYVGLDLGLQSRKDAKDAVGAATQFEDGWMASGFVGYHLKQARIEGEIGYFNNSNKREIVTGVLNERAEGNIGLGMMLFNGYYDFQIKKAPRWKPYVGAGFGLFQSQVNGLTSPTLLAGIPNPAGGFFLQPTVVDTRSRWTSCHQFKVGIGYELARHTEVFLGYRYFKGSNFTLNSTTLGRLDVNGAKVSTVEMGLRVNL